MKKVKVLNIKKMHKDIPDLSWMKVVSAFPLVGFVDFAERSRSE